MKTIKTTKAKTGITPAVIPPQKTVAKAAPDAGLKAAPAKKRPAKATDTIPSEIPVADSITKAKPVAPVPARSKPEITTEIIAARAFILWEQQGRPHGQDLANWLLAERQLKEELKSSKV